jgi:hypothetical protein
VGSAGFHPPAFGDRGGASRGPGPVQAGGDRLGTGGGSQQWDDAGNLLVLAPGVVVSHERNVATHARLEKSGIEVITVPGSELCGARRSAQPVLPGQP